MTTNDKLLEIGKRYLALQDEITKNVEILNTMRQQIEHLLRDQKNTEIKSKEFRLKITKETKSKTSFNSTKFKKENEKIYSNCRKPSLRFDQKVVKSEHPDLYDKYMETTETESINIENYIPDTLDIEDIPEF